MPLSWQNYARFDVETAGADGLPVESRKKLGVVALLYFIQGAPAAILWEVVPAYFGINGVSLRVFLPHGSGTIEHRRCCRKADSLRRHRAVREQPDRSPIYGSDQDPLSTIIFDGRHDPRTTCSGSLLSRLNSCRHRDDRIVFSCFSVKPRAIQVFSGTSR
jgi:hypothetical protein